MPGKANCFPETGPGKNWFSRFCKRHPLITLCKMNTLECSRAKALSPSVISDLLEEALSKNGLTNKGRQIYNGDKTFLPKSCNCQKCCGTIEHNNAMCHLCILEYTPPNDYLHKGVPWWPVSIWSVCQE